MSQRKIRRCGRRDGEGIKLGDAEIRVSYHRERGKGCRLVFVLDLPQSMPIILLDKTKGAAEDVK